MLNEIEITNPVKPHYTARVFVVAPPRCDCENGACKVPHIAGGCRQPAKVKAMYGRLCVECAAFMPAEFLGEGAR